MNTSEIYKGHSYQVQGCIVCTGKGTRKDEMLPGTESDSLGFDHPHILLWDILEHSVSSHIQVPP